MTACIIRRCYIGDMDLSKDILKYYLDSIRSFNKSRIKILTEVFGKNAQFILEFLKEQERLFHGFCT